MRGHVGGDMELSSLGRIQANVEGSQRIEGRHVACEGALGGFNKRSDPEPREGAVEWRAYEAVKTHDRFMAAPFDMEPADRPRAGLAVGSVDICDGPKLDRRWPSGRQA